MIEIETNKKVFSNVSKGKKEFNHKNKILLAIKKKEMLARCKTILKENYIVEVADELEDKNFKNYDLIIVDKINYENYENKFKKSRKNKRASFIPIILLVEEREQFNNNKNIPKLVTEIINIPLVRSIFLNRINLLMNFKEYTLKSENKLKYLAYHDELTGLYNRNFLDQYLQELQLKKIIPISFIVGNINSLKLINQKYGRLSGDQIIKRTANILLKLSGEKDKVVRIGGDEFLIILLDKNSEEVEKLSKKIEKIFANNFIEDIKVSIGLGNATCSNLTQDIENVITTAMSNMYLNKLSKNESMKHQSIKSMINTLEAKSYETNAHAERMKELAVKLGESINLSKREIDELKLLADLHDIGKVAIPESILKKPAKLTKEEFNIIKKHPEIGYEIVRTVPELHNVAKAVLSHHERWDGRGYPSGLKESKIPILARIITIIDAFDVMMNKRAYKEAYSYSYTIKELKRCAGSQFDPQLVDFFLKYVVKESSAVTI